MIIISLCKIYCQFLVRHQCTITYKGGSGYNQLMLLF